MLIAISRLPEQNVEYRKDDHRQKLEDNPQNPRHIHTVRGVGYRFAA
jgi:DNA-binding response OmpR family regulator